MHSVYKLIYILMRDVICARIQLEWKNMGTGRPYFWKKWIIKLRVIWHNLERQHVVFTIMGKVTRYECPKRPKHVLANVWDNFVGVRQPTAPYSFAEDPKTVLHTIYALCRRSKTRTPRRRKRRNRSSGQPAHLSAKNRNIKLQRS